MKTALAMADEPDRRRLYEELRRDCQTGLRAALTDLLDALRKLDLLDG